MSTNNYPALPELPKLDARLSIPYDSIRYIPGYAESTVHQFMADYAKQAIEADRKARATQAGVSDAFEAAMKQTWQMIDPLRPPAAGTYALGEHNGIAAALKTVRQNFERALAQTEQPEAAEKMVHFPCVDDADNVRLHRLGRIIDAHHASLAAGRLTGTSNWACDIDRAANATPSAHPSLSHEPGDVLKKAPEANVSPMAKVADALRQKAKQEEAAYQARRSDQGLMESEWGPMEDIPPHEDPPTHVAVVEGDEEFRGETLLDAIRAARQGHTK